MSQRPVWSNRFMFILASAGSAIGLGNLWKFPYVTGMNGGGAFVLLYLVCIAFVGIPILIAEMYIGQQAQSNAVSAFENLDRKKSPWRVGGWLGLLSAFVILSFYSVVGGWVLDFEFRSLMFEFSGMSEEGVSGTLGSLFADPLRQSLWHSIFILICIFITLAGIKDGLERCNKILMPALFMILVGLFVYSFFLPGFGEAMNFLFYPDFSKLNAAGALEAVGHSFFTLSLGMGAIITYGSFLSKKESLPKIAFSVAMLDTVIALIAGTVIFSIVFSYGVEAASGPGLMFASLPVLFQKLPAGNWISIFFFMLVSFAAVTSAISILEVVVAYVEEKWNWSKKKAVWSSGIAIYLVGYLSLFSTNTLSDFTILGHSFFDFFDVLSSSYLLPIGGLIISLFLGWKLSLDACKKISNNNIFFAMGLMWTARIIAPLGVLLVLLNKAFKIFN